MTTGADMPINWERAREVLRFAFNNNGIVRGRDFPHRGPLLNRLMREGYLTLEYVAKSYVYTMTEKAHAEMRIMRGAFSRRHVPSVRTQRPEETCVCVLHTDTAQEQ